jgi:hypothetical protein
VILALATVVVATGSLGGCALVTVAAGAQRSQLEAAADQRLKEDLSSVAIAAAEYATTNNGSYTGAALADLERAGLPRNQVPPGFTITIDASGDRYCAQGKTKFGQFEHDDSGSLSSGPC